MDSYSNFMSTRADVGFGTVHRNKALYMLAEAKARLASVRVITFYVAKSWWCMRLWANAVLMKFFWSCMHVRLSFLTTITIWVIWLQFFARIGLSVYNPLQASTTDLASLPLYAAATDVGMHGLLASQSCYHSVLSPCWCVLPPCWCTLSASSRFHFCYSCPSLHPFGFVRNLFVYLYVIRKSTMISTIQ